MKSTAIFLLGVLLFIKVIGEAAALYGNLKITFTFKHIFITYLIVSNIIKVFIYVNRARKVTRVKSFGLDHGHKGRVVFHNK